MTTEMVPCPHCGGEIREEATFCRHCGSSDSDGWKEDDNANDAYDEDFDYDDYVQEEFSGDAVSHAFTNKRTKPVWRFVAAVLLLLVVLGYLLG